MSNVLSPVYLVQRGGSPSADPSSPSALHRKQSGFQSPEEAFEPDELFSPTAEGLALRCTRPRTRPEAGGRRQALRCRLDPPGGLQRDIESANPVRKSSREGQNDLQPETSRRSGHCRASKGAGSRGTHFTMATRSVRVPLGALSRMKYVPLDRPWVETLSSCVRPAWIVRS